MIQLSDDTPHGADLAALLDGLSPDQADAIASLVRERDHLVLLHEALLEVERAPSLDARLRVFAAAIRRIGFGRVVLVLRDADQQPRTLVSAGFEPDEERELLGRLAPADVWRRRMPELERFRVSGSYYLDGRDPWVITEFTDRIPSRLGPGDEPGWSAADLLIVPLRGSDGRMVATLFLDDPDDRRRPTLTRVRTVELFGQQVANLVEQALLFDLAQRRAERLQRLQEVGTALARSLDEREICHEIARQVARVVATDGILLVQPDLEQGETRTLLRLVNGQDSPRAPVPLAAGVVAEVARSGRPVRVTDYDAATNPLTAADDAIPEGERAASVLAVPMLMGIRLVGVLVVYSRDAGRYAADDEEVLLTIGAQAASAITNARLYTESETERRQSEALSEVARAVSESLRLGEVLQLILRHALALLRGEGAALALREDDYLHIVAAVGSASLTAGMHVPVNASVSGGVVISGQYAITNDAHADPRAYRATQRVAQISKTVTVPLITARGVIGVIAVNNRDADFTDADARVLQRLADQVAVAIVNARLFEEVATATQEWRVAFDAIPSGMLVLDEDGRIARFNARALQLASVGNDQTLLGRRFAEAVMHEPSGDAPESPILRALRDGVTARATVRSVKRGKVFDLVASPHPSGGAVVTFDDVTELHALTERHRRVVETSTDAIVITDLSRRIAFANPAAIELFAREGELVGTPVDDLLAPGQQDAVRDRERMALAGRPQRYEAVIVRHDGDQRIVSISTAPLRDVGQVTGVVASLRDVTDERRARDAVALSESRYRNLFESASDLIYTLDRNGGITSANDAACRTIGLPASEVLGRNVTLFIAPDDLESTRAHFASAMRGESQRYESRLRRASGEERLMSVTTSPIRHGQEVIGILGIARDVTDDRARAEALARSEAKYTRLVESASDAIMTVDEEGNFTSVNKAMEVATGKPRDQLLGRHFTTLLDQSPDRDKLWVVFAEALRGHRHHAEFRWFDARGAQRTGSVMSAPIIESERVIGGLAVVRDVTDEQSLLQQLLQQEKLAAIGQLVSGVAHELNNPLAGIMAFSQLLLASPIDGDQRQAADTIQHEGKRAAKIVANLLTFARQHPPERSLANLNQVLRDTIALRRYGIQVANIELEVELDDHLPATWADPFQLQQVFLNLLTNAEHAVAENAGAKRITLRSARAGSLLLLSVGDNGPGIPVEQRDRIFNPFFTTKPVGQGTGLGLSISDGIVREHGGRIRVESELGVGATFVVELPLVHAPRDGDDASGDDRRSSGRRCVLVVGGAEAAREALRQQLADHGHDVELAATGDAAIRRVEQRKYDAVILDLRLPDMSGSRLYGRLIATAPLVAERVIFLSEPGADDGDLEWVRGTGRAHLTKPFTPQTLAAMLFSGRTG